MRRDWRMAETMFGVKPHERELFARFLRGELTPKTSARWRRRIEAHCKKRGEELQKK